MNTCSWAYQQMMVTLDRRGTQLPGACVEHLAVCVSCRRRWEGLKMMLTPWQVPVGEAVPDMSATVLRRIRAESTSGDGTATILAVQWLCLVPLAAVCFLVLGAADRIEAVAGLGLALAQSWSHEVADSGADLVTTGAEFAKSLAGSSEQLASLAGGVPTLLGLAVGVSVLLALLVAVPGHSSGSGPNRLLRR